MNPEPTITTRPDQPYVAVKGVVTMQTIGAIADRLPEVFGWLAAREITPAGAPFFKYNLIDMEGELEIEVGAPVTETVAGPAAGGAARRAVRHRSRATLGVPA